MTIKIIVLVLISIVTIVLTCLYCLQDSLIFLPNPTSFFNINPKQEGFQSLPNQLGLEYHWDGAGHVDPSSPVIICFHGNASCAASMMVQLKSLLDSTIANSSSHHFHSCFLYVYEYPGYGERFKTNSCSRFFHMDQEQLEQETVEFTRHVISKHQKLNPQKKFILLGYSLGTGIASHVCHRLCLQDLLQGLDMQLILVTPYSSMTDVANDFSGGWLGHLACRWNRILDNRRSLSQLWQFRQTNNLQITSVFAKSDVLLPVKLHKPRLEPYCHQIYLLNRAGHNDVFLPRFGSFWKSVLFR